jgi:hypothetical protein
MNTDHLIQARHGVLMKEKEVSESGDNQAESSLLNKDMEGALDSFDNLFCRRCLVSPFDFLRLMFHGLLLNDRANIGLFLTFVCIYAGI